MDLEYLSIKLPITDDLSVETVESLLKKKGSPIRWAITSAESDHFVIEAVIATEPAAPSLAVPIDDAGASI